MTQTAVAYSRKRASDEAGREIASIILETLKGDSPDVLIVFSSSSHDVKNLLKNISEGCQPKTIVGCTSAGEFVSGIQGELAVSALALRSDEMKFAAHFATGLRENIKLAAKNIVQPFQHNEIASDFPFRSMLLLTDALAGCMDEFIEEVTIATGGRYQLFGGGAGDDARFSSTDVFIGLESMKDAAVALEILSKKPVGIGVCHGWKPAGDPLRVTESNGLRLVSVNSVAAVEVIEDYATKTGQQFDRNNSVPFFLHNALGIETEKGFKLRVPLSVESDGSLICAADIPVGATIHLMTSSAVSAAEAASSAVRSALQQIKGYEPKAALFFDCVATRLRLSGEFGEELKAVQDNLGTEVIFAGCNTYGQIARVHGQFNGFHNCTAVVCIVAG